MVSSKKELTLLLSQLRSFQDPSLKLEQYSTPPNIAAEWLWNMALKGDVHDQIILDAACGPGILGLGSLILGAKKVYFLDLDENVLDLCLQNYLQLKSEYEIGNAEFIRGDISLFSQKVDLVIQNPPFGTKNKHIDKIFLEKAFSLSPLVYSMHKLSTRSFVEAIAKDYGFRIAGFWKFDFPIKAMFKHHQKPVRKIEVGLWKMEKL
jgi:putative methylase